MDFQVHELADFDGDKIRAFIGGWYQAHALNDCILDCCQHVKGLVRDPEAPADAPLLRVYAFPHLTFQEYLAACHLLSFRFF